MQSLCFWRLRKLNNVDTGWFCTKQAKHLQTSLVYVLFTNIEAATVYSCAYATHVVFPWKGWIDYTSTRINKAKQTVLGI